MGLARELFLNPSTIDAEFICCICHDVLEDPVMSTSCEHVYCKSCITSWISSSTTCPLDRKELNGHRDPHRIFLTFYNRLELRCAFESYGCNRFVNLSNKMEHELKCNFNPESFVTCTGATLGTSEGNINNGCGVTIKSNQLSSHNCIATLKNIISELEHELEESREQNRRNESRIIELESQIEQQERDQERQETSTSSEQPQLISGCIQNQLRDIQALSPNSSNPVVFLDLSLNDEPLGRLTIECRADLVPRTAETFRRLCLGENGVGYKGIQVEIDSGGLYFEMVDTRRLKSVIGPRRPKEVFDTASFNYGNGPGLVAMVESLRDLVWCDFNIFFKDGAYADAMNTMVGVVIEGLELLEIAQDSYKYWNRSNYSVVVQNSGQLS